MNSDLKAIKKYIGSCCGNSFIVLDCRDINLSRQGKADYSVNNIVKHGVDSALFIQNAKGFDVAIEIFEKDGSESDSCGNGMILVSYLLDLNNGKVKMKGGNVVVEGDSEKQALVTDMQLSVVKEVGAEKNCLFVTMGEPHIVCLVENLNKFDLVTAGERFQKDYPAGVNVDAIQKVDESHYLIRTYERGVFGETKSCGTGSLASYIAASRFNDKSYEEPIEFKSVGGSHWISKIDGKLKLETLKKFCEIKNLDG